MDKTKRLNEIDWMRPVVIILLVVMHSFSFIREAAVVGHIQRAFSLLLHTNGYKYSPMAVCSKHLLLLVGTCLDSNW